MVGQNLVNLKFSRLNDNFYQENMLTMPSLPSINKLQELIREKRRENERRRRREQERLEREREERMREKKIEMLKQQQAEILRFLISKRTTN